MTSMVESAVVGGIELSMREQRESLPCQTLRHLWPESCLSLGRSARRLVLR